MTTAKTLENQQTPKLTFDVRIEFEDADEKERVIEKIGFREFPDDDKWLWDLKRLFEQD